MSFKRAIQLYLGDVSNLALAFVLLVLLVATKCSKSNSIFANICTYSALRNLKYRTVGFPPNSRQRNSSAKNKKVWKQKKVYA